MDLIDSKEFRNSKLLFIVLGALLVPVVNSIDSLLAGLSKISGLSLKNLLILSISFHGLIITSLISVFYWVNSSNKHKDGEVKVLLSLKTLKIGGLISFFIFVAAAAVNLYFKVITDEVTEISQINIGNLTMSDLAYLSTAQTGLIILRNILLFTIYFLIVFRRR